MICLDSNRNIIRNTDYFKNDMNGAEFLIIDDWENAEYHFEEYDSEKLIYLDEYDLFYSINDLEKGILNIAPKRTGNDTVAWITGPLLNQIRIPKLERLLKNKGIGKTNAPVKIKERDDYCCQLCGETDERVLNVHHIVPRKSPFVVDSFIHSPINQITLCANCHRIEHYILENGDVSERREHVKKMLCINGYNWRDSLEQDSLWASMGEIRKYNKIEIMMR